jgi:hypothetical protein
MLLDMTAVVHSKFSEQGGEIRTAELLLGRIRRGQVFYPQRSAHHSVDFTVDATALKAIHKKRRAWELHGLKVPNLQRSSRRRWGGTGQCWPAFRAYAIRRSDLLIPAKRKNAVIVGRNAADITEASAVHEVWRPHIAISLAC